MWIPIKWKTNSRHKVGIDPNSMKIFLCKYFYRWISCECISVIHLADGWLSKQTKHFFIFDCLFVLVSGQWFYYFDCIYAEPVEKDSRLSEYKETDMNWNSSLLFPISSRYELYPTHIQDYNTWYSHLVID